MISRTITTQWTHLTHAPHPTITFMLASAYTHPKPETDNLDLFYDYSFALLSTWGREGILFKGKQRVVFFIIKTYLGFITRISKYFGLGPVLVEKCQFFRLISLISIISIYTESTV
jgi:hypothetical protein